MKPPVQLFAPRNRARMAWPRNRPKPVSNSRRRVGVGAKVLVSCEMPPVTMRMSVAPDWLRTRPEGMRERDLVKGGVGRAAAPERGSEADSPGRVEGVQGQAHQRHQGVRQRDARPGHDAAELVRPQAAPPAVPGAA